MARQGRPIPQAIADFVIGTKHNAQGLNQRQIADRVVANFGEEARIDKSSVGRILRRAGVGDPSVSPNQGKRGLDPQAVREHREMLMAPLLDLHEIGLLAFNNYDLAVWYSRPEPCWPITKGQVCRQPDGSLTVRLDAAAVPEWAYLQQHLPDHPIWAAINAWKEAAAADLAARLALLKEIIERIERPAAQDGLGLPVVLDMPSGGGDRPAIGLPYTFALHQQLVARSLGLPHYPIMLTTMWPESRNPNVLYLERGPAVVSYFKQQREDAAQYLVDKQSQWVQLSETRKVGDAYTRAEQLTREVQQRLRKLRLMLAFPRNSVCDVCRE